VCSLTFAVRLGKRGSYPASWNLLDRADGEQKISFMVALRQSNLDELDKIFWAVSDPQSSEYQNFRSVEEINALIAPPISAVKTVLRWLTDGGALVQMRGSDCVEVSTDVATAEKLFNATFYMFEHRVSGRKIARIMGEYSVPPQVKSVIDFVTTISDFPIDRKPLLRSSPQADFGIIPQTVEIVYGTSDSTGSSISSQGVIEWEDQYFSPEQLQTWAQQIDIPIAPLTQDHIVGDNDGTDPQLEATLDIQYIAAVGRNNQNWFWIEGDTAWLYGFVTSFFNRATIPYVISISYGWSEADQCEDGIGADECQQLGVDSTGYVQRVNTEFQKIATRGVSVLISSGDSGCHGRTDGDCSSPIALPDYPAACPYITSVGATQLNTPELKVPNPPPICNAGYQCASGGDEVAVTFDHADFASGGGFSNVAPQPAYQTAAVTAYLKSGIALPSPGYFNATSRAYPDVSAFGSDILIWDGAADPVGGTSASSPIVAGIVGLLNNYVLSKTGKPLGFLNPLFYQMYAKDPSIFIDITVGDNKCTEDGCSDSCQGFLCTKGWDPVTGLGSPNYPKMLAYLQNLFEKK
jgi:subtilase family serine protease